ncbi:SH3 beta-barrel fold-containing protein [Xylanibacter muris]|uniref:SH3 beta-barrel fold-containing protein n=1 Tax=Xylanibacter muris TaxID=2736290 RepID=UPI001C131CDC|nr:SH3 beta-barrel fold-containing protein [Xylanibacter muris]
MINAIVINNATANRATVIATRTQSSEMGIMKAMLIDTLKVKLANGVAHFIFKKKDGTYREAWGTTQSDIANAKTNGRGVSREAFKTTAYFDVEIGEWRSFRWENLVQVF